MPDYKAVVIGAGPAGLFAALGLCESGHCPILIVEQGRSIEERSRSRKPDILKGWGGAGAFSDGKLTLSPEVGGFLSELLSPRELSEAMAEADRLWLDFGAPEQVFQGDPEQNADFKLKSRLAGMIFVPSPVRHMGTENCRQLLADIYKYLLDKGCDVLTQVQATEIKVENGVLKGVSLDNGDFVGTSQVIVAPGRVGNHWMQAQAAKLGLATRPNPVDIGVRVETSAAVMRELTKVFYESKLVYYSSTFDDKVRTFCMNPYGEVVMEKAGDLISVNGHSYARKKTENTNFALLVSATFTEPFDDPIAYGRSVTKLANLLGEGVLVQRLGDLLAGRRSTPERLARCLTRPTLKQATPGDLSYVLPFRILQDIIEMIQAMDKLAPGLAERDTLLYGVEVKFYSHRIELSSRLETAIKGLYVIGDGAGITRGLIQASASGLVCAKAILAANGSG